MRIFSFILCYTRFADQESLVEHGAGSTLYWSGKKKEEHRLFGVGLKIKNIIANKLHILPVGHSDRLISLRLPLKTDQLLAIFSVYAPTLQGDADAKEAFYRDFVPFIKSGQERQDSNYR